MLGLSAWLSIVAGLATLSVETTAAPIAVANARNDVQRRWKFSRYFDIQGHRGARGEHSEELLSAFASGLRAGVSTLELDLGLTKDGHLVVWHDEKLDPTKCKDTEPAFEGDQQFPYVENELNLANLTLAQIKTLDCGSKRLDEFPLALTTPGGKISTLREFFDFVDCATDQPVLFNIETKINPDVRNQTRSPPDFVDAFVTVLRERGPDLIDRVTHQSFDWRALVISKQTIPELRTSALCDDTTLWRYPDGETTGNLTTHGTGPGNWLAGIDIDDFDGATPQERAVQAAASIKADYISPVGTAYASEVDDPADSGWIPFTTPALTRKAHDLGLKVATWTPDRLNLVSYLVQNCSVDAVITDYPTVVHSWAYQQGLKLPDPPYDTSRINQCLERHLQKVPLSS
ncbi:hypothetical protein OIO90_005728 [Microbotryomycetes sp. JL221]|nr:hypothetical protein OIO90_005728 [Microbotryomycetes sp. JL221]